MTKAELLNELQAQRETIITALNFSYIVGSRAWEREFKSFSISAGKIDIEMDRSHFQYVIPRPADLVSVYDDRTVNSAAFALIRITIRTALTESYENFLRVRHRMGSVYYIPLRCEHYGKRARPEPARVV